MGYGSRALELLSKFYEGKLIDLVNEDVQLENYNFKEDVSKKNQDNIESS